VNAPPNPLLWSLIAAGTIGFAVYRVIKIAPKVKRLRQAEEGERAVGQYLERLRENNYHVYHDLLGEGFNVDHVLIGPAGVYSIETKTWSKPAKGEAVIQFDGTELKVMDGSPDRKPIIQAQAQAGWLRALLAESTGKPVSVHPVVLFPGWFVKNTSSARPDLWVLNPKALGKFLENQKPRLDAAAISLLSYHLSRHIRAREAELERERVAASSLFGKRRSSK